MLSIIIVSYNTKNYIKGCLESIKNNLKDLSYEVIVVDNASKDGSVEFIKENFPWVTLIENKENLGFAKGCNQGVKISRGKYILLLNPDTIVLKNSIQSMVELMENNPIAGACGCRLLKPDLTPEPPWMNNKFLPKWLLFPLTKGIIAKRFKKNLNPTDSSQEEIREVDWVSGACMLIRKELYNELGGMDECYFIYMEEIDFCWKLKKTGYKVLRLNKPSIIHYGGGSYKENLSIRQIHDFQNSLFLFRRKNYGRINAFVHLITDILDNLFIILLFSIAQMFIKKEGKRMERQRFIEGRKEALKVLLKIFKNALGSLIGRKSGC
jgi:GT2 family glycosyltransferase